MEDLGGDFLCVKVESSSIFLSSLAFLDAYGHAANIAVNSKLHSQTLINSNFTKFLKIREKLLWVQNQTYEIL